MPLWFWDYSQTRSLGYALVSTYGYDGWLLESIWTYWGEDDPQSF